MPPILYPSIRYRTIDRCLRRKGRRWTWRELAAACGDALREEIGDHLDDPKERTIKGDIALMRSGKLGYQAPIGWDPSRRTYFYADPHFSISNSPLNEQDLDALRHALVILRQFRDFPQVQGIEQVTTKLAEALRRDGRPAPAVIQFEPNLIAAGLHWLEMFYRAACNQRCLQLSYQPFTEEAPYRRIVSPHLLREYNNRWFLFAYDHHEGLIRTFALDRIHAAEVYPLADYHRDPAFHPERSFHNIIGVSIPEDASPETVRLWASPEQANYIRTKPLHASQQLETTDAHGSVFSFRLIHNIELENLLLSFGERVEVLEPTTLRNRMRERVKGAAERYG